eukprot:CAMPEP_0194242764 /NCGR_PEP_ID=MMETSP0158-20130606/8201_1 /TAXON_ID=33649 /ORGANISM="Thalassionema nitzschioides, Strain L26-B" /LENGTH=316 /DNA_ID=CAMNT_0038977919 /DNA_START=120 /DNA_END=1067 /DNA_ORIENTATION=+
MSSSSSLGTTKTKKPPTKALKKSAKSSNNGTATKKKPPTTVSSQKIVKLEADATSRKRPTADECWYATASLSKLHPDVVDRNNIRRKAMLQACGGGRDSITDSVVSTMLSQNTTDANSKAAFSNLKKEFPNWESLVEMEDLPRIESAIKVAGLAKTRAERMYNILLTVKKERGEASLDYIRDFSNEQIKQELSRFKGLGPKTISCVLLFALGRDEFPVDTHVLRITQKMGWVSSSGTSREQAYEYLNGVIPADLKMDLHCLLVQHGKVCHRCAANGRPQFPPKDGSKLDCPLVMISSWGGILPLQNLKSLAALRKM